ncbi:MAG: hypothetical protein IKY39_04325 [Clostridia bacterium]|nr:hypothetical protein [Clostridia bacterium]
MHADVKICVSSRVDFFAQYYDVPPQVQPEVDEFIAQVQALGERSADAQQFEAEFVSSGLSDRFTAILPKCTPKAVAMTEEQKAYSKQVRQEMWQEQKGQIAKDVVKDVAQSVAMRAESDAMQARRRAMSEAGVLDEYTRASNAVDDAGYVAGFLSKLFKKKK